MTTALRDLLPRVVQLFDASSVPFMIAGSVASTTYGLARSTQDIDTVIDPPSLAALEALVKSMPSDDTMRTSNPRATPGSAARCSTSWTSRRAGRST